ncbi:lectin like domain-containing protein [Butyrivibrio sp. DSM 10294]|uniref:lectin like domain-containing protein n=1 Tax=Butyrivibrio sp. DSM 10294 TaxID=2972457 RepID=UPI00234EF624|nr:lectin like domain-containing protein [Butyrivibrio sp. DSM 10294]MDC7293436.1 lectin like domain-containing protein [Butyrivibrio sp. DSM 10294]
MKKRLLALLLSVSLAAGSSVISYASDYEPLITEDVTELSSEAKVSADDENTDEITTDSTTEDLSAEELLLEELSEEELSQEDFSEELLQEEFSEEDANNYEVSEYPIIGSGYMEIENAPNIVNPDMSGSYSPREEGCLGHTQASNDYSSLSSYKTSGLPALRNQSPWGTCWAHAAIALAEINLIKQGIYSSGNIDLSEFHLAYFSYNSVSDPLGGTAGDSNKFKGSTHILNRGGNLQLAQNVLASWVGAADESTAPYPTSESAYKALSSSIAYTDKAHLTDYLIGSVASDKNSISSVKNLIYNYGAVNIGVCADESYYDSTHNSVYTPVNVSQNHDIVLVGWDDNFSRNNFITKAPGDGAWIVRNSWKTASSSANSFRGYYYLSYYDKSISGAAISFVFKKNSNYDHNYQYDGGMQTGTESSAAAAANVFTTKGNEDLTAVSFYAPTPASSYDIKIYTHKSSTVTNPENGTLVGSASGQTTYTGYYTVDLTSPIYLAAGTTFAVVITLKQNGVNAGYGYESAVHSSNWYDVTTSAKAYQSLCKYSSGWQDFGSKTKGNLRIKAFTKDAKAKTVDATKVTFDKVSNEAISLDVNAKTTVTATVLPENATNKAITWSTGNKNVAAISASGNSVTIQGVSSGSTTVTASVNSGKLKASFTVNVVQKLGSLSVTGASSLTKGDTAQYTVTPVPSSYKLGTVTWKSSNTSVLTVNSSGKATCLSAGKARITATSEGISAYIDVTCVEPEPEPEPVPMEPEPEPEPSEPAPSTPTEDWGDIISEDQKLFASVKDVPDKVWIAGQSDTPYTAGPITFDDLRVYDCKKRLTIDKDVTIKYSNNTAVSTATSKAKITVTGIGNFKGSTAFYFSILPLDISKAKLADISLEYNGKVQKSNTKVLYKIGDTYYALVKGTDYTCDYSLVKADPGTYKVTITGKGTYTGTTSFNEIIFEPDSKINIAKLSFRAITVQKATGKEIRPEVVVTDTANNYVLTSKDMSVEYYNNINPGTATIIIKGKGNVYTGSKTMTFRIKATSIAKAKADISPMSYTGNALSPSYTLTITSAQTKEPVTLVKGKDYTAEISGNVNAGKGTITFKGIGKYTGTCTKTFKITPCDFTLGSVSLKSGNRSSSSQEASLGSFTYTKGGVQPSLSLSYKGQSLVNGRDYTVKYINNKAVGQTGAKQPKLVVTGKGNFKGSFTRTFTIKPSSLSKTTMSIDDVVYVGKSGICKPTISIYDTNGAKLTAGTDYDKTFKFTYTDGNYKKKGGVVDSKDIIPAGTKITITVTGKGGYAGTTKSANFTYVNRSLNNATVKLRNPSVVYTGKAVSVSTSDFTVASGKDVWPTGAYKIASITPATDTGVVKVTLKGVGKYNGEYYGGQKTVSFKITAKPIG